MEEEDRVDVAGLDAPFWRSIIAAAKSSRSQYSLPFGAVLFLSVAMNKQRIVEFKSFGFQKLFELFIQSLTMDQDTCPLCMDRDYADQVLEGIISKKQAAAEMGIMVEDVIEHLERHTYTANTPSHPIAELHDIQQREDLLLNNVITLMYSVDSLANKPGLEPKEMKAMVELAREVRQTVVSLEELKRTSKQEGAIAIQNYYDLRTIILVKMLPELKKRLPKESYEIVEDVLYEVGEEIPDGT